MTDAPIPPVDVNRREGLRFAFQQLAHTTKGWNRAAAEVTALCDGYDALLAENARLKAALRETLDVIGEDGDGFDRPVVEAGWFERISALLGDG